MPGLEAVVEVEAGKGGQGCNCTPHLEVWEERGDISAALPIMAVIVDFIRRTELALIAKLSSSSICVSQINLVQYVGYQIEQMGRRN